jgi:hypothetical protein
MSELHDDKTATRDATLKKAKEFFKGKPEFVTLVDRSMGPA